MPTEKQGPHDCFIKTTALCRDSYQLISYRQIALYTLRTELAPKSTLPTLDSKLFLEPSILATFTRPPTYTLHYINTICFVLPIFMTISTRQTCCHFWVYDKTLRRHMTCSTFISISCIITNKYTLCISVTLSPYTCFGCGPAIITVHQ
jgi:hypothetical protein